MKKVICINDEFEDRFLRLVPNTPTEGEIYTIRKKLVTRNGPAYLLKEIVNPLIDLNEEFKFEPSFHIDRFRDLDENYEIIEKVEELECV